MKNQRKNGFQLKVAKLQIWKRARIQRLTLLCWASKMSQFVCPHIKIPVCQPFRAQFQGNGVRALPYQLCKNFMHAGAPARGQVVEAGGQICLRRRQVIHAVRQAWIHLVELGSAQCGYCIPGILLTAEALRRGYPTSSQVFNPVSLLYNKILPLSIHAQIC